MGNKTKASFVQTHGFLHDDIKQNNVLLHWNAPKWNAILVDFGKCRPITKPKKYALTEEQQIHYEKHHPWIAPELVKGIRPQSIASDVFSLGMMFVLIEKAVLGLPENFRELCNDCRWEEPTKRPDINSLQQSLGAVMNTS